MGVTQPLIPADEKRPLYRAPYWDWSATQVWFSSSPWYSRPILAAGLRVRRVERWWYRDEPRSVAHLKEVALGDSAHDTLEIRVACFPDE